jgi:hypothetical protein
MVFSSSAQKQPQQNYSHTTSPQMFSLYRYHDAMIWHESKSSPHHVDVVTKTTSKITFIW